MLTLPITILAALVLRALPTVNSHAIQIGTHKEICAKKHPEIMNAIGQFCNKTDIVVPSWYAQAGKQDMPNRDYLVRIGPPSNCNPPQWVPQKYCFSQFYDMCATGDGDGQKEAKYGIHKCQTWDIMLRMM